jgi:hypothetical protein
VTVEVPGPEVVIMPVAEPTDNTEVVPDDQVPPGVALERVTDVPSQRMVGPEMGPGAALIETVAIAMQPLGKL